MSFIRGNKDFIFDLGLALLLFFVSFYDFLTWIFYYIIQKPWIKRKLARKTHGLIASVETQKNGNIPLEKKSTMVSRIPADAVSVTYKSATTPKTLHITMLRENIDTVPKTLEYAAKKFGHGKCLGTRQILAEENEMQPDGKVFKKFKLGDYKWKSYIEVNDEATYFGRGIRDLGNKPLKNVVMFAETRAEWMIAAHGLFKQNIPIVTIYATLGNEAIAHGINETEVTTVITSFDLLPKFKKILELTPKVKTIIYMEDQLKTLDNLDGYKEGVEIVKFSDVVKKGSTLKIDNVESKPEDTAIIMYTSGSTGRPKGVLLSQKNLITTIKAYNDIVTSKKDDVLVSILPLAHVLELSVENCFIMVGVPIGYSSALTLLDSSSKILKGTKGDLSVLQPTILTAVPLILERVYKSLQDTVNRSPIVKKMLFKFALDYKIRWKSWGYSTPTTDKIVFNAVKRILGGKLRIIFAGGAPLSAKTHEVLSACFCLTIQQGYGLTEASASSSLQDYYDTAYGRVGGPTSPCLIKLINWEEGNYRVTDKPNPRGEIVLGGNIVSPGYYKLPDATKENFCEDEAGVRWFTTGDIGEMNSRGVLKIIDRKKDLVKLQAGEYVSLGKVESQLKSCPFIDNVCVYGESSKNVCIALIVPNEKTLKELAVKLGVNKTFEELCKDSTVEKVVLEEIQAHGKRNNLEKFEIPAGIKLISEIWSPDNGLLTTAFKLKRKQIQERFIAEINALYNSS